MIWGARARKPPSPGESDDWYLFEHRFAVNNLEVLFDRHKHFVFRVAFSYCHNKEDADDVVQELFTQLASERIRAKPKAKFRTWLYACTRNIARAHQRNSGNLRLVSDNLEHDTTSPDQTESSAELDRVFSALAKLPERQREVFVARRLELLDTNETARALGISAGTVKAHLSRANIALAQLLEPSGNTD